MPSTRIRIVSKEGEELPEGRVGEIVVTCDHMFSGYFNRPDLDAAVMKDGWYWSRDLGFVLNGELFVIGRGNDMMIVAGQNIYPEDLEAVVSWHSGIMAGRTIVFGLFNPEVGTEEIVLVAEVRNENVLQNPTRLADELRSMIAHALGFSVQHVYLKPPRWIVKSTAGKPARSWVREKLLNEHAELRYE